MFGPYAVHFDPALAPGQVQWTWWWMSPPPEHGKCTATITAHPTTSQAPGAAVMSVSQTLVGWNFELGGSKFIIYASLLNSGSDPISDAEICWVLNEI